MIKLNAPMSRDQITRRQWLALAALALPFDGRILAAQVMPKLRKKVLCLTAKNRKPQEVAKFIGSVGARWLYNWNIEPPTNLAAGVEYIPMI